MITGVYRCKPAEHILHYSDAGSMLVSAQDSTPIVKPQFVF